MGKSSRDKRDIYYRLAKEEGWRARSAYKLLQIDDEFEILTPTGDSPIERVVDLCAAPGSWSQVLSKRLWEPRSEEDRQNVKIVAVDLQAMAPIPGVIQLQGDITSRTTADAIIEHFGGKLAQLVVCDGAPDVTGLHDLDEYVQSHLVLAALTICARILMAGGCFVAKVFRGRDAGVLAAQLQCLFEDQVTFAKPRSSRNSSLESFVICRGFIGPELFRQTNLSSDPTIEAKEPDEMMDALLSQWYQYDELDKLDSDQRLILPFVACGDLSGYDADLCYTLEESYTSKAPVQPPIHPAYSEVCRRKRSSQAAHQKAGDSVVEETVSTLMTALRIENKDT